MQPTKQKGVVPQFIDKAKTAVYDTYDEITKDPSSLFGDAGALLMGLGHTAVQTFQNVTKPLNNVAKMQSDYLEKKVPGYKAPEPPVDYAKKMEDVVSQSGSPGQKLAFSVGDFVGWGIQLAATEKALPETGVAIFGKYSGAAKEALSFVTTGQILHKPEDGTRAKQAAEDLASWGIFKGMGNVAGKVAQGSKTVQSIADISKGADIAKKAVTEKAPTEVTSVADELYKKVMAGDKVPLGDVESAMSAVNESIKDKTGGKTVKELVNGELGNEVTKTVEERKAQEPETKPDPPKIIPQKFTPEEIDTLKKQGFTPESMNSLLQKESDKKFNAEWEAAHPAPKVEEPKVEEPKVEETKVEDIKSAAVTVEGKTYEGANHEEAIAKAEEAGADTSAINKEKDGEFVMKDGSVKTREELGGVHSEDVPQLNEGKTPSKAALNVNREALAKGIAIDEGGVAGYDKQLNNADAVIAHAEEDPQSSVDIAMGKKDSIPGVKSSWFYRYVANKAEKEGDVQMIYDLTHNSSVPRQGSSAGQFVRGLGGFKDKEPSVVDLINESKPDVTKEQIARQKTIDKIKKEGDASKARQLALDFIKKIECK